MKIEFFDPGRFDVELKNKAMDRVKDAAEVIANHARTECPEGTVSFPMYQTGKYAGQKWTSRDAGRLRKSIRVVEPDKGTIDFGRQTKIRVYAGHYMAWYAAIVEFESKFMRKAKNKSRAEIKAILGTK